MSEAGMLHKLAANAHSAERMLDRAGGDAISHDHRQSRSESAPGPHSEDVATGVKPQQSATSWSLQALPVALGYYVAAELGLSMAVGDTNASPLWPPAGIAVAAVLILGYRVWPGVFLGAFLANMLAFLGNGFSVGVAIVTACGIGTGNTLEAIVGVFLLRWVIGSSDPFDRAQSVIYFAALTVTLATIVGATIGVVCLCLGHIAEWADFGYLWRTWWIGNAIGVLIVAPVLLAWVKRKPHWGELRLLAEVFLIWALLGVISWLAFGGIEHTSLGPAHRLEYLPVPIVLWATFRFGLRGAATSILIAGAVATWCTVQGYGPFAVPSANDSVLLLHVYLAVVAVTALVLAAVLAERKHAEDRMLVFRRFSEASGQGFGMATLDGEITYVNPRLCQLIGESCPDDVRGKTLSRYYPPTLQERLRSEVLPGVMKDGQWTGEMALVTSQGLVTPTIENIFLIRNEQGDPLFLADVVTDITERKHDEKELRRHRDRLEEIVAERTVDIEETNEELRQKVLELERLEQSLKESERLYRSAIEVADAVPYYLDYETNTYEFIGGGIHRLTGYARSELTPNLLQEITEDDYVLGELTDLPHDEAIERARRSNEITWRSDFKIRTREGGRRWLSDAAIQVRNESGEVVGTLGILQDITGRKESEEDKSRLEAQLRQSQKMEAVGQLAGGVAHDFNNLLQAILGYVTMGMSGLSRDERRYRDLEQVKKAGERAATLTRQLLTVSRRQVLQPSNVNLNDIITDVSKMLRRVIGEHIELAIERGDDLETVRADAGMMEQVILNLSVNARDAMPDGGQLTIKTGTTALDAAFCASHAGAHPGRYVLLSVKDTGIGMPPETLEHIFEPFYTTKDAEKGTGLGLSMVYGIVKQHEGLIYTQSELGQGTTFDIYLPAIASPAAVVEIEAAQTAPRGTETILLAEDDTVVQSIAVRVLEEHGYTVLAANDGKEAIALFEKNMDSVDLAFLDVVMPKMGGPAVYERIQHVKPDARVLFSSGYNPGTGQNARIVEEGLTLIQKPYSPDELLRNVREALDGR